jgi:hypothetical protein
MLGLAAQHAHIIKCVSPGGVVESKSTSLYGHAYDKFSCGFDGFLNNQFVPRAIRAES